MITKTSSGTASASSETPLQACPAGAPALGMSVGAPPSPALAVSMLAAPPWPSALTSIGKPLQASVGMLVPTGLLLTPAAALAWAALPALPTPPAWEPPWLEGAPGALWGFPSTVLPGWLLQAMTTKVSRVSSKAIVLGRWVRIFPHLTVGQP